MPHVKLQTFTDGQDVPLSIDQRCRYGLGCDIHYIGRSLAACCIAPICKEVTAWLEDNAVGNWTDIFWGADGTDIEYFIHFSHDEDATLFKIRWL